MAEIDVADAPKKAVDLFNKGFGAFERNNLDYAIDLLSASLEICPGLLKARRFLRAAEIKRFKAKKAGFLAHRLSIVKGMPDLTRAQMLVKAGKGDEALLAAEKLLRLDPLNVRFIRAFAEAAELAGLPEAGVQSLEIARDHYPADTAVLEKLGAMYQKVGRNKDARACFEQLCELDPRNPSYIKLLKDAMALESMRTDGWEETAEAGGTFREMIRDEQEAVRLEQESKAVKSSKDVDALIEDALAKIEGEPENINYYRSLARLYAQKHAYRDAVATLEKASEISSGDPEVAAALTRVRVQEFEYAIGQAREAGDEAAAQEHEQRKAQFIFDDLQERVKRYPNDLNLRFDLGLMMFQNDYFNEAIQQFQLAQRSPKHKVRALYYLGLCFKAKKQYDLAAEQLGRAAADLELMDDTKKSILYELGAVAEAVGDAAEAARYYKEIYQVDIGFKDVAEKVEQVYSGS